MRTKDYGNPEKQAGQAEGKFRKTLGLMNEASSSNGHLRLTSNVQVYLHKTFHGKAIQSA